MTYVCKKYKYTLVYRNRKYLPFPLSHTVFTPWFCPNWEATGGTTPQRTNSENSGKYLKAAGSTHTVFTIGSVARADATVYMSGFWAR